jgi:hypothetical protein
MHTVRHLSSSRPSAIRARSGGGQGTRVQEPLNDPRVLWMIDEGGFGRGERRQTTLRHLTVPANLPLEIEVTGMERWLPRATA